MKKKLKIMKKVLLLFSIILVSISLFSQSITTQSGIPVSTLVQDTLINGCIQAFNVTANNGAYGYFKKGNSQFPFQSGIIMSTGAISAAQGPNTSVSMSGASPNSGSDPDLAALVSASLSNIKDACIIEFDFIPASDTIEFRYIFGSEEFPEFANSSYNDVFGFFLSGPGINGPYSNNAINIALLPNNLPVTIDNVHNYNYYYATPSNASNSPASYHGAVQFDGNTIVLTARAIVQACETYHIKLAIGDRGDSAYDSGVFLEAGSFVSGGAVSIANTAQHGGDNDLWEGCTNYYVISRAEGVSIEQDLTIDLEIDAASTATEGVDFTPFPSSVTIPAGEMTDTIFYSAYNDGIEEGTESIIVSFYTSCPCGNQSMAIYDTIWIYDAEFIKGGIQDIETEFYCGEDAPATITLIGECNRDPNINYLWSTGEMTNSITIYPQLGATTYYLTMLDECNNEVLDSITIRVNGLTIANANITNPKCNNGCDGIIDLDIVGEDGPFTFEYAREPYHFFPDSVHTTTNNTFSGLCPGTYRITVTDQIGCFKRYKIDLPNPPSVDLATGIVEDDIKTCEALEEITFTAVSNQPNPIFAWSTGAETSSITVTPQVGVTNYWVKIYDACGHFKQDEVKVQYSQIQISSQEIDDNGDCDGFATVFANGGVYPYTYYWEEPIGNFGETQMGLCVGEYQVKATDAIGCSAIETITIKLHEEEEEEEIYVPQSYYDDIFTVFPNPTKDEFVIDYKKEDFKDIIIKITDIKSNIISETKMISNQTVIKNLEAGIYFVNLFDTNGIVAIQRVVITK